MNVEQKHKVLKVLNDFFNEADTSKMSVKKTLEISEVIDLVKNLHIPVVSKSVNCEHPMSHRADVVASNQTYCLKCCEFV